MYVTKRNQKLEIISLKKKANESFVQSGQERRASEWKTEMDTKTQRMKYGKNWKQVKKDMEKVMRAVAAASLRGDGVPSKIQRSTIG